MKNPHYNIPKSGYPVSSWRSSRSENPLSLVASGSISEQAIIRMFLLVCFPDSKPKLASLTFTNSSRILVLGAKLINYPASLTLPECPQSFLLQTKHPYFLEPIFIWRDSKALYHPVCLLLDIFQFIYVLVLRTGPNIPDEYWEGQSTAEFPSLCSFKLCPNTAQYHSSFLGATSHFWLILSF